MRNILTVTTAAFALCATTALAGNIDTTATVTDHYKTIIQQKPYNVEVCKDVTVHKNGSNAGEGALGGMIIGGVLGKVLGGNDKGAAAGAILGGVIGADKAGKQHGSSSTHRRCSIETRYQETQREVYSHSIVMFYHNGIQRSLRFEK
jgi:uncharacterized protein YcfJ